MTFSTMNMSETTRNRAIVTIERQYEVTCALSSGDMSNDVNGPITPISRSQHFWSRISQNGVSEGQSYYRTLIGNHNHTVEWYHFQWLWLTLHWDFKVAIFFDIVYVRNDTTYSCSYYEISIESHRLSVEWWHFQWPSRTPSAVFKVTVFFEVKYPKISGS